MNPRRSDRNDALVAKNFLPIIEMVPLTSLNAPRQSARIHPSAQVREIAASITAFGFLVPMVADKGNTIRAGVGRYEASKFLKLSHVPVVRMEGLSAAKMRAFTLADNKIAEHSRWDRNMLAIELPELTELLIEENLDIAITGFSSVEIDQISIDFEENSSDPEDDINEEHLAGVLISRAGDQGGVRGAVAG